MIAKDPQLRSQTNGEYDIVRILLLHQLPLSRPERFGFAHARTDLGGEGLVTGEGGQPPERRPHHCAGPTAGTRHPDPRHPRTTTGKMTRHVPAAGSYAPVTLLVEELADHRTRVYYDEVASAIAPYDNPAASAVAARLDGEVLSLLRGVAGV
jgi:hypothetical protein